MATAEFDTHEPGASSVGASGMSASVAEVTAPATKGEDLALTLGAEEAIDSPYDCEDDADEFETIEITQESLEASCRYEISASDFCEQPSEVLFVTQGAHRITLEDFRCAL